jgi:hypothetical protein
MSPRTCSSSVTTSDCALPPFVDGRRAREGVSCQMCGAGKCRTFGWRSIWVGDGGELEDREKAKEGRYLSHYAEEGLHPAIGKPTSRRRL